MLTRRPRLVVALLILIAAMRLIPTYRVFSATADEATHVGAGLEAMQLHRYWLQRLNPPLARVVLALVPYAKGMRFNPAGSFGDQLHSVFYGTGKYESNLFAARIGNLVFLAIGTCALFAWTRAELDTEAALVATFLFTFQPVILGHAGLATNDMAATAGLAVAVCAFAAALRKRTIASAALFGAAYGFAVACKFSNIAFVPIACGSIFVIRAIRQRAQMRTLMMGAARMIVAVVVVTPLTIWAAYAFSIGRLHDLHENADAYGDRFVRFVAAHPNIPLPAPMFFDGVGGITKIDRAGFTSFFFGEVREYGFPWYFPVVIAMKTTIAFLLLIAAAAFVRSGVVVECAAIAAIMLLLAARSNLDLGIRYLLPIYVPLTFISAATAMTLFRQSRHAAIAVVIVLAAHGVASLAAHPDYFPYFNLTAGRDPSRYFVDSNLDWGQDVLRLRKALQKRHVDRVGLSLMGSPDLDALHFPPHYPLSGEQPTGGWIAISDHVYRMENSSNGAFGWLYKYKYKRIGTSIRLTYIPYK